MELKVLVCGGRDYKDRDKIWRVLDSLKNQCDLKDEPLHIIEGQCPTGADLYAGQWAAQNLPSAQHHRFPANWMAYQRGAGPIRNRQMLEQGKPDLVVAFGGVNGTGTNHMVRISKEAPVPPMVVEFDRHDTTF